MIRPLPRIHRLLTWTGLSAADAAMVIGAARGYDRELTAHAGFMARAVITAALRQRRRLARVRTHLGEIIESAQHDRFTPDLSNRLCDCAFVARRTVGLLDGRPGL